MSDVLSGAPSARAFWIVAPGRGEIRETVLPPPETGTVRVAALFSGISRGTESLVFLGKVPESQYQAMRCPFQDGTFPFPVKYGYASVGRVEAGPETLLGRRVFCLHPHQDRYDVPDDAVLPIPDAVPDARAAEPRAARPSAVPWVFRRDQALPWPAPQPAVRFARAMQCLQIALP